MAEKFCECCGNAKVIELDIYKQYKHFRCDQCGYEVFDHTGANIASELYENDSDYIDDLKVFTNIEDLLLWHHEIAIKFVKSRYSTQNIPTLDVGCFNGFFVKKLHSLGFNSYGIDFNKNAITYGQEKLGLGFRISTSSIDELISNDERYELITLFEVLEHLKDPKVFLTDVIKLLSTGGGSCAFNS